MTLDYCAGEERRHDRDVGKITNLHGVGTGLGWRRCPDFIHLNAASSVTALQKFAKAHGAKAARESTSLQEISRSTGAAPLSLDGVLVDVVVDLYMRATKQLKFPLQGGKPSLASSGRGAKSSRLINSVSDMTCEEICEYVVLPQTSEEASLGAKKMHSTTQSWIEMLRKKETRGQGSIKGVGGLSGGKPSFGKANKFISYSRQMRFVDLLDTLRTMKGLYLWVDIFCADQHAMAAPPEKHGDCVSWLGALHTLVQAIGHTALIVDRVDRTPDALHRLWCIAEIAFTSGAAHLTSQSFEVVFPEQIQAQVDTMMLSEWEELLGNLTEVDVASASATAPEWDEALFGALGSVLLCPPQSTGHAGNPKQEHHSGAVASEASRLVSSIMRDWLADAARERLRGMAAPERSTASLTHDVAVLLKNLGRLAEARPLFRLYLAGMRRVHGECNEKTLSAYHELGELCHMQWFNRENVDHEELRKGLAMLTKAFEGRKTLLGPDHPQTLISLDRLSLVYQDMGELPKALELSRRAGRGLAEVLGLESHATLTAMGDRGVILRDMGDLKEANEVLTEVLTLKRKVFGQDHGETIDASSSLAWVYRLQNEIEAATELLRSAVRTGCKVRSAGHPATQIDSRRLQRCLTLLDEMAGPEGRPDVRAELELLESLHDGSTSKEGEGETLLMLAEGVPQRRDRRALELPLLEEIYETHRKELGENSLITLQNLATVGWWHCTRSTDVDPRLRGEDSHREYASKLLRRALGGLLILQQDSKY